MTITHLDSSNTPWTLLSDRRRNLRAFDQQLTGSHEFHILGAGLSGLVAAVEITELNKLRQRHRKPHHKVFVYEGSDRVGGRVMTHRVGKKPEPGKPDRRPYVELGAMRIPESHDYTWTYAREGGLKRREFRVDDHTVQANGKVFRLPDQLNELMDEYKLTPQEKLEVHRRGGPGPFFHHKVVRPELQKLDSYYRGRETWSRFLIEGKISNDRKDPLWKIDQTSHHDMLEEYIEEGEISQGARNFIVDLLYLEDLLDVAFLMTIRNTIAQYGERLWELCKPLDDFSVLGGMDLLTRSLMDRLPPDTVRCGVPVERIQAQDRGRWQVHFKGGHSISAGTHRHLLCTIPFSKLNSGDIVLDGFSKERLEIMHGPSYMDATKVGLYCTSRFWRPAYSGGRSISGTSTDGKPSNRTTYYSNDHHVQVEIPETPQTDGHYTLYTEPWRFDSDPEPLAADESRLPNDWVLLSSYTFGQSARDMESETARRSQENLAKVFHNIGEFTEPDDPDKSPVWSWRKYEWTRGAVVLPTPGNVCEYFTSARTPYQGIFFAGCGISFAPGWIQGAAYSSLYALEHIQRTALGLAPPDESPEDE